jgi:hypothetical protein
MKSRAERIVVPDVDCDGRFRFDPAEAAPPAHPFELRLCCAGCGCSHLDPCIDAAGQPCSWAAAHVGVGIGLCTHCAARPLEELLHETA